MIPARLRDLLLLAALLMALPAWAVPPDTTDPRAIMTAVQDREAGDRMKARLHITITDRAGRERTRVVQTRAMDHEGGRRQLLLFESPADVRNAGLLSIDWDDASRRDDQWLYLPSVGRTMRISGADRSGSFMGTDLTYADMTRRDPEAYDYELVEASVQVDGEDCWLIQATPRTDDEIAETGYLRTQVWVSKDKLMPVQVRAWVREGQRQKFTRFGDFRQVDGHWIAHRLVVRTVRNNAVESTSTLVFSDVAFDAADVTPDDFTERRLERGL